MSATSDVKANLEKYIEQYIEKYRVPGLSAAILHEGEVFYTNAWGVTGESGEQVTAETPFLLGSISKSLTGLAIMKLIEEEKIKLEDPVQSHLPWFSLKDENDSKIKVKHLLAQTSGLSSYSGLLLSDKGSKNEDSIKLNVKKLSNTKLTSVPGKKHQYSGANYLILGALIEEVSGQSFSEYMEQQIFLPLGMSHSVADHKSAKEMGLESGYQSWFGYPVKSNISYDNGGSPYGYMAANTNDMIHYLKFINGNHFLKKDHFQEYFSPLFETKDNVYYGFGWRFSEPKKEDMIWHNGSTPDSRSEIFYLPDSGWSGVILTNKNHVLEEEYLSYLKFGIINILNGEEPEELPNHIPILRLITLGVAALLVCPLGIVIYKRKQFRDHLKLRGILKVWGVFSILLSIVIVPILVKSLGTPWYSISIYAPDLAWIIRLIILLLILNGLISLFVAGKKRSGVFQNQGNRNHHFNL
ncbi:serine hydrolase domain-containing protein [Bacillus pakistanensis]|uniref:serine hydrolase domain-containing protein n=1 Tax=Rossellomorea pakistanensis TaxID=992288 RepID=UPI001EF97E80|nr:serine hydrolase domain-containing protein [Bacillus pakistanensis]